MLHVSPPVCFGFQLTDFLPWVFLCLHVSQVYVFLSASRYNGFQESRLKGTVESATGMQSIKCIWTCLSMKHQVIHGQGYQDEMALASQWATPSTVVEGSTLACDKWKRKVVDNTKVEQGCKFKKIHLWWKKIWRLRLWSDTVISGSHKGRERKKGVANVEEETQGRTGAAQMRDKVAGGTSTIGGATSTDWWNCAHTNYIPSPTTGME